MSLETGLVSSPVTGRALDNEDDIILDLLTAGELGSSVHCRKLDIC